MKSNKRLRRYKKSRQGKEKNKEFFFSNTKDATVQNTSDTAFFQTKLAIGPAGGQYEQEADQMADAVVNKTATPIRGIQPVQFDTTPHDPASNYLGQRINQKKGNGKKMPEKTRQEMEIAFGKDFGKVNIHTDRDAAELNNELGAQAFATGKDVFFNAGKYNPETTAGKHLLAHELTHVVQQGASTGNVQLSDDPSLYLRGENYWFNSQGQAWAAVTLKATSLGKGHWFDHHPLPTRGLPHYHLRGPKAKNGHYFYKTRTKKKQRKKTRKEKDREWYKIDWTKLLKVMIIAGVSASLVTVVAAAILDPEPATKLALAGLATAQIALLLSLLGIKNNKDGGVT